MIGYIQYGLVKLDMIKVNNVNRRPVMSDDGVDYLYTETVLDVSCLFSPEATSFSTLQGQRPVVGDGTAWAGETDRILQDYLMTPRRRLTVWTLDSAGERVIWLQSPPPDAPGGGNIKAPCDAKNGPICTVGRIIETDGPKTWLVNLQFTTWINNCYDGNSPILSHRWEQYIDTDQDGFAIITRRGSVVFNAGRLYGAGQSPDWYHGQFFQAPPLNFAREKVNVTVASDNSRADYTVIDRERPFNLGTNSPATRVEAVMTTSHTQGTITNIAAAVAPSVPMTWNEILFGGFGAVSHRGPYDWRIDRARATAIADNLPKYRVHMSVQAWGGRRSTRKSLYRLCVGIATRRIGPPDFINSAGNISIVVSQDAVQKWVRLEITYEWSERIFIQLAGRFGEIGVLFATHGARTRLANGSFVNVDWLAEDQENMTSLSPFLNAPPAGTVLNDATLNATQAPIGNRPFDPTSFERINDRGPGFTQYLMTQGLMGQCEVPDMPGENVTPVGSPRHAPVNGWEVPPINVPLLPIDGRL